MVTDTRYRTWEGYTVLESWGEPYWSNHQPLSIEDMENNHFQYDANSTDPRFGIYSHEVIDGFQQPYYTHRAGAGTNSGGCVVIGDRALSRPYTANFGLFDGIFSVDRSEACVVIGTEAAGAPNHTALLFDYAGAISQRSPQKCCIIGHRAMLQESTNVINYHDVVAIGPNAGMNSNGISSCVIIGRDCCTDLIGEPYDFVAIGNNITKPASAPYSSNWLNIGDRIQKMGSAYGVVLGLYTTGVGLGGGNGLYIIGDLLATGNVSAYSDINIKKNIKEISNPLHIINSINGVTYTLKRNNKKGVGVLAQEVEKVLPNAVRTDPEGLKYVSYNSIIGLMIAGVNELSARLIKLENA